MTKHTLLLKLAALVPHSHYRHVVLLPEDQLRSLLKYYNWTHSLLKRTSANDERAINGFFNSDEFKEQAEASNHVAGALDRAVREMHKQREFSGPQMLIVPKDTIKRNLI